MQPTIDKSNNILLCNKCGREVDVSNPDNKYIASMINFFHDFYVKFNYSSLRDGMEVRCKICECCIMKLIHSFKIPLILTEYDILESIDKTIEELDLPVRAYCALKRAGIDFVYELEELTEQEVIKIKNINSRCINAIKSKVSLKGEIYAN